MKNKKRKHFKKNSQQAVKDKTHFKTNTLPHKIFRFFKKNIFLCIITPYLGYNITNIISNSTHEIKYSAEVSFARSSATGEIEIDINHLLEDNYNFNMAVNLNILSGEPKDLYLVYTPYDNQQISNSDFHELSFESSSTWSNLPYKIRDVLIVNNGERTISKASFTISMHYNHNATTEDLPKQAYLLSIDKENNASVQLINVNGIASSQNARSSNGRTIVFEVPFTPSKSFEPQAQLINKSDFLKNRELDKYHDQFDKDTDRILKIYKKYYKN